MSTKNCGNCNWNIACKCENSDWKTGHVIENPENPECGYNTEESKTPIGWIPINLHYINVGDIVEERNHSQEAPTAVVVSMNPFTLVCTKTGTVWKSLNLNDFHTVFKARKSLFENCLKMANL